MSAQVRGREPEGSGSTWPKCMRKSRSCGDSVSDFVRSFTVEMGMLYGVKMSNIAFETHFGDATIKSRVRDFVASYDSLSRIPPLDKVRQNVENIRSNVPFTFRAEISSESHRNGSCNQFCQPGVDDGLSVSQRRQSCCQSERNSETV